MDSGCVKHCCVAVTLCVLLPMAISGCGGDSPSTTPQPIEPTITTTAGISTSTTTPTPPWGCQSSLVFPDAMLKGMEVKGMAMDDTTMSQCSEKITGIWPHTKSSHVKYLRLFAAWKSAWGDDGKMRKQWTGLKEFCHNYGVKIFLGVDSDANESENQKQFDWAVELMKQLGKEYIIGFSFGNEMLNKKDLDSQWWDRFLVWCKNKVVELDTAGFQDVPITAVWSMAAFEPIKARSNKYINSMHAIYQDRWVWAVNPYPLWDTSQRPRTAAECHAKTQAAISPQYTIDVMSSFRDAVTLATGNPKAKIWVGENGWANPCPKSLHMDICSEFCSPRSFQQYYQGFLQWDGQLKDGREPPEYIFFFTNRDAKDHDDFQPFGLIQSCQDDHCKLQADTVNASILLV